MTISVISYPLESMGGVFGWFFPWKIYKYHIHLRTCSENHHNVWKIESMYVGTLYPLTCIHIDFKVKFEKNESQLLFYMTMSFCDQKILTGFLSGYPLIFADYISPCFFLIRKFWLGFSVDTLIFTDSQMWTWLRPTSCWKIREYQSHGLVHWKKSNILDSP